MIEYNLITPKKVSEFIVIGACTPEEIMNKMEEFYPEISLGVLWNFDEGDITLLTPEGMKRIAHKKNKYACHERTAYFTTNDLTYGILRQYESYAEIENVIQTMRVFKNREDAVRWISFEDEPENTSYL